MLTGALILLVPNYLSPHPLAFSAWNSLRCNLLGSKWRTESLGRLPALMVVFLQSKKSSFCSECRYSFYFRDDFCAFLVIQISIMPPQQVGIESYNIQHIIVLFVFSSLAIVAVILRFWSRRIQRLTLEWNDYLIIPGLVFEDLSICQTGSDIHRYSLLPNRILQSTVRDSRLCRV